MSWWLAISGLDRLRVTLDRFLHSLRFKTALFEPIRQRYRLHLPARSSEVTLLSRRHMTIRLLLALLGEVNTVNDVWVVIYANVQQRLWRRETIRQSPIHEDGAREAVEIVHVVLIVN